MENIQKADAAANRSIERAVKGTKSGRAKVKIPDHLLMPPTDTRTHAEKGLENFERLEREAKIKVLEGRLVELDKVLEAGK